MNTENDDQSLPRFLREFTKVRVKNIDTRLTSDILVNKEQSVFLDPLAHVLHDLSGDIKAAFEKIDERQQKNSNI